MAIPKPRQRQFVGGSWLHSVRRGPLDRQIVTQSSALAFDTPVRRGANLHGLGVRGVRNAMRATRNLEPDP
jgi:hypothetical protein